MSKVDPLSLRTTQLAGSSVVLLLQTADIDVHKSLQQEGPCLLLPMNVDVEPSLMGIVVVVVVSRSKTPPLCLRKRVNGQRRRPGTWKPECVGNWVIFRALVSNLAVRGENFGTLLRGENHCRIVYKT